MLVDLDEKELGLLVRVVSLARHTEAVLQACTEEEQGRLRVLAGKLDQARNKEMDLGAESARAAADC
jgi:hypothetical protein